MIKIRLWPRKDLGGVIFMWARATFLCLLLALTFVPQRTSAVTPWSLFINTNNIIVVTNSPYNATTNSADNSVAISNAITAASAGGLTNTLRGGVVEIPAGTFLSGPIQLKNNVQVQIDSGGLLRMLPLASYPGGVTNPPDFLTGSSVTNIAIVGPGAIDGQGTPWWTFENSNRPVMIHLTDCSYQMIQNITLSNSPKFHISFSNNKGSATVDSVTVRAPSSEDPLTPSHNTDACDVSGTNVLVQNCNISTGDDDFTCGSSTWDVLVTNNTYGNGHGISMGSFTKVLVSNIVATACTINGADNGLRIKSDNDRGGMVRSNAYLNIGITNVHFPLQAIAYYNTYSTPDNISPSTAASQTVAAVTTLTPIYRDLIYSNITATMSTNGHPIGIIWARTEMPATNIIFNKVKITGDQSFDLYNVNGAQFIDCNLNPTNKSDTTFELFNAQVIITNSVPTNTLFTFDGLTTNGYHNSLALYNALGSLRNTNVLDSGPLTLSASTLTVSNNLNLSNTVVNFALGTNATQLAVVGNLTLGGTNYISAGSGFGNGVYTLMTYTGTLSGSLPVLGSVPAGFNCSYDTSTSGQVNLVVGLPAPTNLVAIGTNLQIDLRWNAVAGASTYNLKRGTTSGGPYPTVYSGLSATNYADTAVTNEVSYFYVVSAVNAGGEGANSLEATAVPLPSNQPTNITVQASGGQIQLSWPQDHLGWLLQVQTNSLAGTNWVTLPGSTNVISTNIVINPSISNVFFRMVYP